MTRQDNVINVIRNHNRRLQKLKEQQALYGIETPPRVSLEIEDIEGELEQLQTELKEIENDVRFLPQRVEQQRQRIAEGLPEIRQQATEKMQTSSTKERLHVVGQPPMGIVEYFKDRIREQEKIVQLLAEPSTRLVSVIGHGGMGKTALASKVLRDLEQYRWPHTDDDIPLNGIVYLSTRTAGISLERLFLDCAKVLGGDIEAQLYTMWTDSRMETRDKTSNLLESLKGGQYVILLDNMEDLLDNKGQIIDEDIKMFFDQALTLTHGARLLVTSRLAMTLNREVMRYDQQIKLLKGLPIVDGITLLRELDPNGDYGLLDASDEDLGQTVELVHGVPRALEVIAGILANDPFASLNEVMGQFYEHEDVVEALIEENYKRLDNSARRVIEALAVFRRPVPPVAVDYLLEPFIPGLDVPGTIRRLIRTNIVNIDRSTKTVALHPIDQSFAYSQLMEDDGSIEYSRQALERRAADYYVQLRLPEENWKIIDDLEPQLLEFEHRFRAQEYESAHYILELIDFDYLTPWGHTNRLFEMRKRLLENLSDPQIQAANLTRLGRACRYLGQFEEAEKYHEKALAIVRKIGDRKWEAENLGGLGIIYRPLGKTELAIKSLEEAVEISSQIGDQRNKGIWLGHLAGNYRQLLHTEQAINYFKQALNIARNLNDRRNESAWLDALGFTYIALGQINEALRLQEESLIISREIGDRQGEQFRLGNIGYSHLLLGEVKKAQEHYNKALFVAQEIGSRRDEGAWLGCLGLVYSNQGEMIKAVSHYREALAIAREFSDRRWQNHHLIRLGQALLTIGELSEARRCCQEALDMNIAALKHRAGLTLGIVLLHQKDPTIGKIITDTIDFCQSALSKTASLYERRYILATALVENAVCDPDWKEVNRRPELLIPALAEYQKALKVCDAPGVIRQALHNLELIQAAGIEGLEPVFKLFESKLDQ